MPVTTVRPDSSAAGLYTVTGAATAHAALSDNSDASYIRRTNTTATKSGILYFGTAAITSSQLVRQVRLRARAQTTETTSRISYSLGTVKNNQTYFATAYSRTGVRALATYEGPWLTAPPGGGSWNQTKIDNLLIQVTDYATTAAARGYTYELYIDVDIANQPTVTVSSPTGAVTASSTPTVAWSFADSDGDSQAYYQIKVFSAAQYGAVGFDPATSTPVWDSGEVASELAASAIVGTTLSLGTYRAYVRVAKTVGTTNLWSAWAFSEFDMIAARPATPSLTLNYSVSNGRVEIVATGVADATFSSQTYTLQRSTDQQTWTTIRGGTVVPDGSMQAAVNDYEAPRGGTVYYRAKAVGLTGSDQFASFWSAARPVTATNDGTWWIKPLSDLTASIGAVGVRGGWGEEEREAVGVFRPITRDGAVTVTSGLQGRDGQFTVVAPSEAEWQRVEPLLLHTGPLYWEDPLGEAHYVKITGRSLTTTGTVANPVREVQVAWVEVQSGLASEVDASTTIAGSSAGAVVLAKESVLWLDAQYGFASQTMLNLGTGGSALNAQFGATTGVDATDPPRLAHTGTNYVYLPGVTGNHMTVGNDAAFNVTGDAEWIVDVAMDDWTPSSSVDLVSRGNADPNRAFRIRLYSTGRVGLGWWPTGSSASGIFVDSTGSVPFTDGQRGQIKVSLDVDNGSGQYVVTMATSTDNTTWTPLTMPAMPTVGTTALPSVTASVGVFYGDFAGAAPFSGKGYRFRMLNGIGGTAVLDVDTSVITSGAATSFAATTGQTVTINRSTSGRKSVAVVRPILLFGGSNYLQIPDNNLIDFAATDSFAVLMVYRQWATPQNAGRYYHKGTSTGARYGLSNPTTALQGQVFVSDGVNGQQGNTAAYTAGQLVTITGLVNRSTQQIQAYLNNTAGTAASTSAVGTLISANVARVGLNASGTSPADFEFVGMALFRRVLTAAEIAAVVSYYGT